MTDRTSILLLWCGVLASTVFILADIASSTLAAAAAAASQQSESKAYSMTYNSISELLMPDASPPISRYVAVALMSVSDILGILFGLGGVLRASDCVVLSASAIARSTRTSRTGSYRPTFGGNSNNEQPASFSSRLRVRLSMYRGGMLMGMASFCNLVSATMYPQDVRGEPSTFAGRMHIFLVATSVLISLPAMYFLSSAIQSKNFQQYTYLTVSLMFAGGMCAPLAEQIGVLGIAERVAAYAYVLWQAVLAFVLMRYKVLV
jgi:hypothetical protein